MKNKAHTATLNRICRRFGVKSDSELFDIETNELIIEVETSATVASAIERLKSQKRPSYVAVTNKEGIKLAMSVVQGTGIGVMDPTGEILLEAEKTTAVECHPPHDTVPSDTHACGPQNVPAPTSAVGS